ncbi:MAG TPA: EpsG family protein [Gallicola sp.]|nr:EpsG family protein [Gallicola sp.]
MIPFFVLSIIILFLSFVKRDKQLYLFIALGLILIIIAGFRTESVGTDTINYSVFFERIKNHGSIPVEPGWVMLNKLVQFIGADYSFFMAFVSVITLLPLLFIFYKNSENPILSLFFYYSLYIYFYSFNISRQVLAVSIVLIAIILLIKNKKILFLIFLTLAALFHISALIALPLFFIDKIPNKTIVYISGIGIAFIIGVFLTETLSNYLIRISSYSGYLEANVFGNVLGNAMYLILLNAFFIFVLLTITKRDILFKMFFAYFILANLLARIPFGGRVLLFYSIFLTLFLPYYLHNNKIKEKFIPYGIVILYALIMFYRSFGGGEILPYTNIMFKSILIN